MKKGLLILGVIVLVVLVLFFGWYAYTKIFYTCGNCDGAPRNARTVISNSAPSGY